MLDEAEALYWDLYYDVEDLEVVGFVRCVPIYELRAIKHDPHSGQFMPGSPSILTERGQPLSTKPNRVASSCYEKMGVQRIEIDAGYSHGRYVWAKMGFSADEETTAKYIGKFKAYLERKKLAIPEHVKSLHDIATYQTEGKLHGKDFLMAAGRTTGPDKLPPWKGWLNSDSPHWAKLRDRQ